MKCATSLDILAEGLAKRKRDLIDFFVRLDVPLYPIPSFEVDFNSSFIFKNDHSEPQTGSGIIIIIN